MLARLEADGWLAGTAVRRVACSSLGEPTYGVFGALFREGLSGGSGRTLSTSPGQKLAAGLVARSPSRSGGDHCAGTELRAWRGGDPYPRRRARAAQAADHAGRANAGRAAFAAAAAPIIVEDLHWADAASVDLLRDVVDHLADRRLMMLFSHRPDMRPPVVARAPSLSSGLTRFPSTRRGARGTACSVLWPGMLSPGFAGFCRDPGRGQSAVRRGDRPQPDRQRRACSRRRHWT